MTREIARPRHTEERLSVRKVEYEFLYFSRAIVERREHI